jgi:hypothetical protein
MNRIRKKGKEFEGLQVKLCVNTIAVLRNVEKAMGQRLPYASI